MARIIAVLILVTAMVLVADAQKKCGQNEEYLECGSPCTPTCAEPYVVCAAVCVARCQCKKGYLVNSSGKCIKADKC